MTTQFLKQWKLSYYLITLDITIVLQSCAGHSGDFRGFSTVTIINSQDKHIVVIIPNILGLIAFDCQTALIMWRLAIWTKSSDTGSTFASEGG